MTTSTFKPVFGPNGAVMNAPTMTPEVREDIKHSSAMPRQLMQSLLFLVMIAAVIGLQLLTDLPVAVALVVPVLLVLTRLSGSRRPPSDGSVLPKA